jgi:hypothetical protein
VNRHLRIILGVVSAAVLSLLAFSQPVVPGPEAVAWIGGANGVASQSWTRAEIANFLRRLPGSRSISQVGDFRFADLAGDGRLELVATVDYSGREFFNSVFVVQKQSSAIGYDVQEIEAWNVQSLEGVIKDLNGDRKFELVIPMLLTPYLGARSYAVWRGVFAYAGHEFLEDDLKFLSYYKTEFMPEVDKEISELRSQHGDQIKIDALQIALERAARLGQPDNETRLRTAMMWSQDADPVRRIFAVSILADIGGAAAKERLQSLTHDSDNEVQIYAESALAKHWESTATSETNH